MSAPVFSIPNYLKIFKNRNSKLEKADLSKKFGFTHMPKGPHGRYAYCSGSNLVISKFTENHDLAWEFVRFMCSFESQVRHSRATGNLPSSVRAFDKLYSGKNDKNLILKQSYKKDSRLYRQVPTWATIEMILCEGLFKITEALEKKSYSTKYLKQVMNKSAATVDYILDL